MNKNVETVEQRLIREAEEFRQKKEQERKRIDALAEAFRS